MKGARQKNGGTGDGPMQRLEELGKFLTDRVGVEAVRAIAFPVRPKE
jgi:hypothetical protein